MFSSIASLALEGARLNTLVITAIDLKLNEILTNHAMSCSELATAATISERGAQAIADGMVALKLWRVNNGEYSITEMAKALFVPGHSAYIGERHPELYRAWLQIFMRATDVTKTGRPVNEIDSAELMHLWSVLTPVLSHSGQKATKVVIDKLNATLIPMDILDIGGGAAALYSLAFLEANSRTTATQVDWEQINDLAEKQIASVGLADRFDRVDGNLHDVDIKPDSYDVAILSHILHLESPERIKQILRKVHGGLRNDGYLVIADWVVDDGRVGPPPALMFNFTMLLLTAEGRSYEKQEIIDALEYAGFSDAQTEKVDAQTTLIFTKKKKLKDDFQPVRNK